MSTKSKKLSSLNLSDKEKQDIAEMVETPGFRVWIKKIVPHREIQIALTNISMGTDEKDLWYNKGMASENGKGPRSLKEIADDWNKGQIDEGEVDNEV